MPGAGREAGLFAAGHLVRQRAGRGGPGSIGAGSRRRGPIMPGHLQEGFGCVVTNRFDQLFDDESDPFEVLRAAESRRKESGGGGGAQGGGGARGGPAGAQSNSSGGAGGGGPGQAGSGGGAGSAAKQLRRESQKERKNPLPPFAASAGGERREEGGGQPGAPLRKEGERRRGPRERTKAAAGSNGPGREGGREGSGQRRREGARERPPARGAHVAGAGPRGAGGRPRRAPRNRTWPRPQNGGARGVPRVSPWVGLAWAREGSGGPLVLQGAGELASDFCTGRWRWDEGEWLSAKRGEV